MGVIQFPGYAEIWHALGGEVVRGLGGYERLAVEDRRT